MRRRSALTVPFATAAAATAALGPAPRSAALATETWCDVDPVQLVATSGGAIVPIFVTNGAPSFRYAPQLLLARITHVAEPAVDSAGGAATLVVVTVTVPNSPLEDGFPVRSVVTSGPAGLLTVHAAATGISGVPISMRFLLPVA